MSFDRFWIPCFYDGVRFPNAHFQLCDLDLQICFGRFYLRTDRKSGLNYTYNSCPYPSTVPLSEVPLVANFAPFTRVFRSTNYSKTNSRVVCI